MSADDLAHQFQKYKHEVGGDIPGDCYRTALACLLEMPLEDVPHFVHIYDDESTPQWWYASIDFVERVRPGWSLKCVSTEYPVYVDPDQSPKRVILSGQSPRGDWNHCVLVDAVTGELEWDVYQGGEGVLSQIDLIALVKIPVTIEGVLV